MSPSAPRRYTLAALAVLLGGALLQLALGWTTALPAVDCYGTLMQVSRDPRVMGHVPPSFAQLGMEPGGFWHQVGAFYSGTGRAYVAYLAYIQAVALLGGFHAAVWHVLNTLCVTAAIALLWSTLRRLTLHPALALAGIALLFVPFADPHGLDLFGYLTSAEAPGLLFLTLALRLALVPGWLPALAGAVLVLAALLSKESLVAFLPLVVALRYFALVPDPAPLGPDLRRLLRAAAPAVLAIAALGLFMLAMRKAFPPIGAAYVGVAGATERGKPIATVVVSTLQLFQQFLPIGVPPIDPRGIVLLVLPRLVTVAALVWLAHACGWRLFARGQWQARRREVLVVLAGLTAVLATFFAYWLLGRMPPADFHLAPVAFAAVLTLTVAANFLTHVEPPPGAWRVPFAVVLLTLLACAAQGPRPTLWLTLAGACAVGGVLFWHARTAADGPALRLALLTGVVLLLFVPRLPVLVADRSDVALAAEELQTAVTQMVAQPPDATVHVELAAAGWIEYAWALRGYATLLGRADLRLCISLVDAEYSSGNAAYVRRLIETVRADDAQRTRTPTTLTVYVRRDPVQTASIPLRRAVITTGPATQCAFP